MPEGEDGQAVETYSKQQVEEMVAGLKNKNAELLGKVKDYSERVKPYEGLDPDKARKALESLEKAEAERAKAVGDWDAREKALRDQFAAEHQKVVEPLSATAKQLENDLFDAVAVRDAMEAIANPTVKGNPKLLLPIIRPELAIEVVDGKRVTVVKGADGKARYHPTSGQLVTVKDRLEELRAMPEYGGAFEGAGGSGGGASPAAGASVTGAVVLTPDQAGDAATYQAALAKVGGDHSKIVVK